MKKAKELLNIFKADPLLYLFLFLSGLLIGDYITTHKVEYSILFIVFLCAVYAFIVQFIYSLIKRKLK